MNYERAIELLVAVKKLREEGKNKSPYVCDNLDEVADYSNRDFKVIFVIQSDVDEMINSAFSAVYYLKTRDHKDYTHDSPEVLAFRRELIDNLILKYQAKFEEGVKP